MLQFIVLGLVPGTQLQITLGWLLALGLFIVAYKLVRRHSVKINVFLKTPIHLKTKKTISKPSA